MMMHSDDYIADDLDFLEESDFLNDETFGTEPILEDEWEIEDLANQTAKLDNGVDFSESFVTEAESISSTELEYISSKDWYKNYEKSFQELIERDLSNLLTDDDDSAQCTPFPSSNANNLIANLSHDSIISKSLPSSSDQNFSTVFSSADSTEPWSFHRPTTTTTPDNTLPSTIHMKDRLADQDTTTWAYQRRALDDLLSKLGVASSPHSSSCSQTSKEPTPSKSGPRFKTLAELEAEMMGHKVATSKPAADDESKHVHPSNNNDNTNRLYSPGIAGGPRGYPPALPFLPGVPVPRPPYPMPPPVWTLNPQFRAATFAAMATGRPPPPGGIPPPFPMQYPFGHRFDAARRHAVLPNRGGITPVDPRFFMAYRARMMQFAEQRQPLVKVRPIVSADQLLIPMQLSQGYRNEQRRDTKNWHKFSHQDDEYAGLMSRREREWLVKIQSLQLHTDQPYVDDYYWLMYKKKRRLAKSMSEEDSEELPQDLSVDYLDSTADSGQTFEPRSYVPPNFEGSLGKLHLSSTAGPRHILDLKTSESSDNDCTRRQSSTDTAQATPTVAGRPMTTTTTTTPTTTTIGSCFTPQISANVRPRFNTALLLDIENGYLLVLECEQLLLEMRSMDSRLMANDIRNGLSRIILNTQRVIELIAADSKRFQNTLLSRKGRRIILKLFPLLQDAEKIRIIRFFAEFLRRSSPNRDEIFKSFFNSIQEIGTILNASYWPTLFDLLLLSDDSATSEFSTNERLFCLLLFLLSRCSKQNVVLPDHICQRLGVTLSSFLKNRRMVADVLDSNSFSAFKCLTFSQNDWHQFETFLEMTLNMSQISLDCLLKLLNVQLH